jgi:hypothetical protein
MSCQRCGGVLASELADAMYKLVCEMAVIEGRHCHCDDIEGPLHVKLPWEGRGAFAGESPATTTSTSKGGQND